MKADHFFYNCSREYIDSTDSNLYAQIIDAIFTLPKRLTQAEINRDLFWILTDKGWSFDSAPSGLPSTTPKELGIKECSMNDIKKNSRSLCCSTTTLEADWHTDFAKAYDGGLVQVQVQFGKVELMFKDFCGFRIAYSERRLRLGIEIVMANPNKYFAHRKSAISGMAYFDIAKTTLPSIGLDCAIWLVGIRE